MSAEITSPAASAFPADAVESIWVRVTTRAAAYVRLTKPRVIELLLVTAVPPMVLANRGFPPMTLLVAVVAGGTLAAGGANALNCAIERDRDSLMERTRRRPSAQGVVRAPQAYAFGVACNVIAFAVLAVAANLLAAALTLTATVFYVAVYTIWLKPRTPQNIVIGGAAGAVPALVGWVAVRGQLGLPAWILFAVVVTWTPAHFWALAIKYRDDYARAGIPMLPVVAGIAATTRQIFGYTVATVALTGALVATGAVGWLYVVVVAAAGSGFFVMARRLRDDPSPERAIRFFGLSNVYLLTVFVAVAADALTR